MNRTVDFWQMVWKLCIIGEMLVILYVLHH